MNRIRFFRIVGAVGIVLVLVCVVLSVVAPDADLARLTVILAALALIPVISVLRGMGRTTVSPEVLDRTLEELARQVTQDTAVDLRQLLDSRDVRSRRQLNLALEGADNPGTVVTDLDSLGTYFGGIQAGRLLILGEPGAGKTVAALRIAVDLLGRRATGGAVPVRFSLSGYRPGGSLVRWLSSQLAARFTLEPEIARALIAAQRILPILDSLDEMDEDSSGHVRAERTIRSINEYFARDDPQRGASLIVTCRADAYPELSDLADIEILRIRGLQPVEISDYLRAQAQTGIIADLQRWGPLLDDLDPRRRDPGAVARFLSTPWRLILMVTVCESQHGPSPVEVMFGSDTRQRTVRSDADVDESLLAHFVSVRIERYNHGRELAKQSETAVDSSRRRLPNRSYSSDEVTVWLTEIARCLMWLRYNGKGEDLVLSEWWRAADRPRTTLTRVSRHSRVRWLHGILATVIVAAATFATTTRLGGPDVVDWSQFRPYLMLLGSGRVDAAFASALLVVLVGAVVLPIAAGFDAGGRNPLPRRVSLANLRAGRAWRNIGIAVLTGSVLGALIGVVVAFTAGLAVSAEVDVLVGGVTGAAAGLILGAAFAVDRRAVASIRPPAVIIGDLSYGVLIGSATAVLGGVGATLAAGWHFGLVIAIALGAVFGFVLHSAVAIRYALAVLIMRLRGRLPLRFALFLEWTVAAGLLREVGVSYQFRHSEFERWLIAHA